MSEGEEKSGIEKEGSTLVAIGQEIGELFRAELPLRVKPELRSLPHSLQKPQIAGAHDAQWIALASQNPSQKEGILRIRDFIHTATRSWVQDEESFFIDDVRNFSISQFDQQFGHISEAQIQDEDTRKRAELARQVFLYDMLLVRFGATSTMAVEPYHLLEVISGVGERIRRARDTSQIPPINSKPVSELTVEDMFALMLEGKLAVPTPQPKKHFEDLIREMYDALTQPPLGGPQQSGEKKPDK